MKKRILALFLIVAVVAGALVVAVGAEGEHENHCACIQAVTGVEGDKCASHNENQAWSVLDPASLPTSGYYYLKEDLVLSAQWNISGDLHLCTNGHDISRASTASESLFGLIRVGDNKSLTITNCKAQITNDRLDTSDAAKTSTLSGGKSSNTAGALIHLNTNSTLKLYGVEVANNTSSSGNTSGWGAGAVLACNTGINMDVAYAAFRNNSATATNGGAITIRGGTTNIRNTVFSGNTAEKSGAAIYMCNAASNVTITDCDFTGNETKSGEGGAALYIGKGSATLTNVTMTDNVNKGLHGSAITQNGGTTLKLNNCTITGNRNTSEDKRAAVVSIGGVTEFSVSGKTVIRNNLNNGKESNVLLREHNNNQPKITVGALTDEANISVRTVTDKTAGDFLKAGTNCPVQNGEKVYITYENNLLSTNATTQLNHGIHYNGTAFSFGAVADHKHADCVCVMTGATCDAHTSVPATPVAWQKWISKTSLPTAAGYYYLTGDVTLSAQQSISGDVHICTNGFDITRASTAAENLFGLIRVGDSKSLAIMNCKAVITDGQLDTSDPAKTSTLSGGKSSNTCGAFLHANKGADVSLMGVEFKNNESLSTHATWSAGVLLAVGNNGTKVQNIHVAYSAFNGNHAASVGGVMTFHGGIVKIRNTAFTGNYAANGGAVYMDNSNPDVTVTDCVFADNGFVVTEAAGQPVTTVKTAKGGAVNVIKGSFTAENTAFTGNRATHSGAAVFTNATVTAEDVTFSGNKLGADAQGGAAVYVSNGATTLKKVTITDNESKGMHGSAITQTGGNLTLEACTVTNNRNSSADKRAAIVVIGGASGTTVTGKTVISGNLNDGKESNVLLREYNGNQPKLTVGAVTDGTDITVRTVAKITDPNLFMAAATGCPNMTDEMGWIRYENRADSANAAERLTAVVRFDGTKFSFGAVEEHKHYACACAISGVSCDGHTELTADWQMWAETDKLPTTAGYYYLTDDVTLTAQQVISGDVYICTNGFDITRASTAADNLFGLIRVSDNKSLTLVNCKAKVANGQLDTSDAAKTSTISGGKSSNTCGALLHANKGADVRLIGVEFKENVSLSTHALWSAGVLLATGDNGTDVQNIHIAYTAFNKNRAATTGGAVTFHGGVVNISNTTFAENRAVSGGAIRLANNNPDLTLTDCVFTDNGTLEGENKTTHGGAIFAEKGTVKATNVAFSGNAAENGGAIYSAVQTLTLDKCAFGKNEAVDGGAIFSAAGTLAVTDSTFTGNKSSSNGGAIALHSNTVTPVAVITGGTMQENTSGTNGSAIFVSHSEATVTDTILKENVSGQSGAVYVRAGGKATFNNVTISENENSGPNGSALTAEGGSHVMLNGCRVVGNVNTYDSLHAGVVMVDAAELTISGETVIDGNLNGGAERNVFLRTVNTAPKMTVGQLTGSASVSVATSNLETDPDNFLVKGVSGAWNPAWSDKWISYDNNGMAVSFNEKEQFFFKVAGQHDNHCLCAGEDAKCDHKVIKWQPWGKSDSLPTSGNYYLTKDVVLTKGVDINNTQLNLCLNGHSIKQTGSTYVLNIVGENGALAISDCTAKSVGGVYIAGVISGGKNGAVLVRNNTFKLYDGMLAGNSRVSTGGAVVMLGDGKFYMYNGQISGNESSNSSAGAVSVEKNSVMYLYDGMIRDNKSMMGGAIALNEGTLYMYGGILRNNTAVKHGGAIHLFKSTAEISGGQIFKNTAAGGAGIQASRDSKVTMTGGKIEGNITTGNGGGVQLSENSQMKMSGGDICWNEATLGAGAYLHNSQITVSGGSIRNNTTAGKDEKGATIYGSGGGVLAVTDSKVTITGGRVQDNLAWHGSGIYVINSDLTVSGGYIQNNGFTKDEKGKTVYITRMGGGIYANGSKVTMTGGEVRGNRSENGGGIYVRQGGTFLMTGGEVWSNAAMTGNGGGIVVASSSKVTIKDGKIRNNNAKVLGGGIFVDGDKQKDQGSTLVMSGGTVRENRAEKGGGILLINYSHMDYTGGEISSNAVSNNGGGLFVANFCTMKMTGGNVKNNKAVSGAGVQCYKAKADIYGGTISGNTALENGGGIFSQTESTIILHGGTVTKNTAKSMGGGMFANVESTLGIYGGKVVDNTAEKGGGVLVIDKSKLIVKGGTVEKNTATNNGGGIFVANTSEMKMTGGKVANNKAISGAGLAAYMAKATMTGGVIENNEASQHGAGFLIQRESVITMKDVTIRKNTAAQNGGAVHISGFATLDMEKTTIEANTAGMAGGGIFASGDKTVVTMRDSAVRTNTAGQSGGGLSAMSHAKIVMESGKINHNQATLAGGGIYVRKGYVDVLAGEIFQNTAGTTGGGLSVEGIDIIMRRDVLKTTKDVKIYENTADQGGGIFLGTGQATMTGTVVENNLANQGGGFCALSMGRSIMDGVIFRGNTAKAEGGGLYFRRGTKSYLTGCEITGNISGAEGGGIWVDDDFQADSCRVTGNKAAKGAGGIHIAPASYDGEAYVSTVIKLGGNMQVTGNEGEYPGLYIGEGTFVNLMGKGLAQDAKMDVALATGVLTNTLFGSYNYEGGNLNYVVTAGDRSITDPEPVPQTESPEDVTSLIWIPIAVVLVILVAGGVILLLTKKKKSQK